MKETAEIIIKIVRAVRGKTPDLHFAFFVGVDSVSTRPEGPTVESEIAKDGWAADLNCPVRWRAVVELPDGVHSGPFKVANVQLDGLYADQYATDGLGCAVFASVPPVQCTWGDRDAAVSKATEGGILMHIPVSNKDHSVIASAKIISLEQIR